MLLYTIEFGPVLTKCALTTMERLCPPLNYRMCNKKGSSKLGNVELSIVYIQTHSYSSLQTPRSTHCRWGVYQTFHSCWVHSSIQWVGTSSSWTLLNIKMKAMQILLHQNLTPKVGFHKSQQNSSSEGNELWLLEVAHQLHVHLLACLIGLLWAGLVTENHNAACNI